MLRAGVHLGPPVPRTGPARVRSGRRAGPQVVRADAAAEHRQRAGHDLDAFLAQLGSRSYLLTASPGQRAEILTRARAVADAYARDGRLVVPVRTTVLTA